MSRLKNIDDCFLRGGLRKVEPRRTWRQRPCGPISIQRTWLSFIQLRVTYILKKNGIELVSNFDANFLKLTSKNKAQEVRLLKKISQILNNPSIGTLKRHKLKHARGSHVI